MATRTEHWYIVCYPLDPVLQNPDSLCPPCPAVRGAGCGRPACPRVSAGVAGLAGLAGLAGWQERQQGRARLPVGAVAAVHGQGYPPPYPPLWYHPSTLGTHPSLHPCHTVCSVLPGARPPCAEPPGGRLLDVPAPLGSLEISVSCRPRVAGPRVPLVKSCTPLLGPPAPLLACPQCCTQVHTDQSRF